MRFLGRGLLSPIGDGHGEQRRLALHTRCGLIVCLDRLLAGTDAPLVAFSGAATALLPCCGWWSASVVDDSNDGGTNDYGISSRFLGAVGSCRHD